jgi:hypothetical protein
MSHCVVQRELNVSEQPIASIFGLKDGSDIFAQNVGLSELTLQPKRPYSSNLSAFAIKHASKQ